MGRLRYRINDEIRDANRDTLTLTRLPNGVSCGCAAENRVI